MAVTFLNLDLVTRMAEFDVDGLTVSRQIAESIGDNDIDNHLIALANGLAIEYQNSSPNDLTRPASISSGTVLVES